MIEAGKDKIEDLFSVSDEICIATTVQNVPLYDFDFRQFFQVRSVFGEKKSILILRIGAIHDYEKVFHHFEALGLTLIHSIEQHNCVSYLPNWYPLLHEFTPASKTFETIPDFTQVEANFQYPVFLKGERQTHKHKKDLCVAESRSDFERICLAWKSDPVLQWQRMIVREFVELMPVESDEPHQLRKAVEVRTFVWFGTIAGKGQYWESNQRIVLSTTDEARITELARWVYARLAIPFMVIDFAKTLSGEWIIIELNDAQESGYAMTSKIGLWNSILEMGVNVPGK